MSFVLRILVGGTWYISRRSFPLSGEQIIGRLLVFTDDVRDEKQYKKSFKV